MADITSTSDVECTQEEVDGFIRIYRRLDSYGQDIIECMIWIMSGENHRLVEYDDEIVADARARVDASMASGGLKERVR